MASKKSAKSVSYYAQRLFEDEYVQGQLRDAASGIRSAYHRIAKKPERAAEDKKVYGSVRQAAVSIRKALIALRRPEPEPKHRLRTVLTAIAVVAASVVIIGARGSKRQPPGEGKGGADALDGDEGSERSDEPETAPSTTSE